MSDPTAGELDVFGFPVQLGKVQPPLLPPETLERERLLEWMAAKIHSRLVLIVADAGYGKTTLLADWSRRTRLPVLWYRLDETDRDWVVFVNHVVAAGREIDPGFAPNTMSLLGELGAGMGDRTSIVRTLLTEIRRWVTGGTALLLDDYHVVDDVPEVREIVRELLVRGPERLAVVVSTRRAPTLPLARLRALGEVAELSTADLRFDRGEMERLFRDTYRHPLEADLLEDLARTTEGWAATLRLVETAVRGRSREEVRTVIQGLSARHGDLHDYLAEEVVGRMPTELQDFLERCALLHVATPQLAAAAADVSAADARRLLDVTEEAGLLSRRGRTGQAGRLLHPLVRSFLEGRLLETVGPDGIAEIHARIAAAAEPNSWWLAGHHYAAAGRHHDVARVLSGSLEAILGSGGAQAAVDLMTSGLDADRAWHRVLVARRYLGEGRFRDGAHEAHLAWQAVGQGDDVGAELVLMTLIAACFAQGDYAGASAWASALADTARGRMAVSVGKAVLALAQSTIEGSLDVSADLVSDTAQVAADLGHWHFYGISMLNLGWVDRYRGLTTQVEQHARAAEKALSETSAGPELSTVHTLLAWSLAHKGEMGLARTELEQARTLARDATRYETLVEAADIIGAYVDPLEARDLLAAASGMLPNSPADEALFALTCAENELRCGNVEAAEEALRQTPERIVAGHPAFLARRTLAELSVRLAAGELLSGDEIRAAMHRAMHQGAHAVHSGLSLLSGAAAGQESLSRAVKRAGESDRAALSIHAEMIAARLLHLDEPARSVIRLEATARPTRWRPSLRRELLGRPPAQVLEAALLLELIGDPGDVAVLRRLSRELKGPFRRPDLGRGLARRIAPRVWVEDQGRVVLRIGDAEIPGTSVRRKALALLCYLLTRPGFSASRDQVLDALWPDQDPEQSVNSLHQTAYFLRRVFEPDFSEDLSPGYLNHNPEMLWLDTELVDSRSSACRRLLDGLSRPPSLHEVDELSGAYRGPFALDFAYEDWASPYRETLHAHYLETLERAIQLDIGDGRLDRAMFLSRRVLDVDPDVDEIERTLLGLYRATGAHAAAAEQYGHYAATIRREFGVEPPSLRDIGGPDIPPPEPSVRWD
jgi:LuxR family maltose regulon positive regulatory protein